MYRLFFISGALIQGAHLYYIKSYPTYSLSELLYMAQKTR